MTDDDAKRRLALLESTLREILRINKDATADAGGGSADMETALDGKLLTRWKNIRRKAESLVGVP